MNGTGPLGDTAPHALTTDNEQQATGSRNSALVAAGILLSRIAGLVRTAAIARYLGVSAVADAFQAAMRIPNLLQNLLGEGVLSASFIPVYSRMVGEMLAEMDQIQEGGAGETIRRDLSALERQGVLRRVHGGAIPVELRPGAGEERPPNRSGFPVRGRGGRPDRPRPVPRSRAAAFPIRRHHRPDRFRMRYRSPRPPARATPSATSSWSRFRWMIRSWSRR